MIPYNHPARAWCRRHGDGLMEVAGWAALVLGIAVACGLLGLFIRWADADDQRVTREAHERNTQSCHDLGGKVVTFDYWASCWVDGKKVEKWTAPDR